MGETDRLKKIGKEREFDIGIGIGIGEETGIRAYVPRGSYLTAASLGPVRTRWVV